MTTFSRLTVAILALILAGCASIFGPSTPPSCNVNFKTTNNTFEIKGISIPVNGKDFKVGSVYYDEKQSQRISDSIRRLEQYRLSQCTVLETMLLIKPHPADKIEKLAILVANANNALYNISDKLASGNDPAEAAKAAETISTAVIKNNPPGTPAADLTPRVLKAEENIKELTEEVEKIKVPHLSSSTAVYTISGFKSGAITLTPLMKNEILHILTKIQNPHFIIDFVGYADSPGNYYENLQIGLARAKSAAYYFDSLNGKNKGRIRLISSGGIASQEFDGRRVDIHISRANL